MAAFQLLCVHASGQWIDYPTKGIPRTAAGKPNLSAPALKMANGHTDFSGVCIEFKPWTAELHPQLIPDTELNYEVITPKR